MYVERKTHLDGWTGIHKYMYVYIFMHILSKGTFLVFHIGKILGHREVQTVYVECKDDHSLDDWTGTYKYEMYT